MQIFTREFLKELEDDFKECDRIDIVMDFCGLTFAEAILEIAKYCDVEPKYFEGKKEHYFTRCKAALQDKDKS